MPTITVSGASIPQRSDITLRRGGTVLLTVIVTNKDYTGYTLRCEVRDQITKRLLFPTTPVLASVIDGDSTIIISKSASQLQVRAGIYSYDLMAKDADGWAVTDIIYGTITIDDDVTLNVANVLEDDDGDVILTN